MSPVELVKVTQQCSSAQAALSARNVVSNMLMGSRQWRRGLNATLLRDGIPHGVWFVSYEVAKDTMMKAAGYEEEDDLPVQVPLVSGAVAATVAWGVGYPADLIKTRIQAASSSSSDGILSTGRQLVQEADGKVLPGLYRGFGMKLVRSIPASMIGFTVYEGVKEQILKIE